MTDGSPLPGRRERKKLATRHALSSAALQLAVERGLENVTIEDITARADVSLRTFRNYFASKYEAICAIAADRARHIGASLLERPASEPLWDAIVNAVLQHYQEAGQALDPELMSAIKLVMSSPAIRGEYLKRRADRAGIANGGLLAFERGFRRRSSGMTWCGMRDNGTSAVPGGAGLPEEYAARFDDSFGRLAQRRWRREYLAGVFRRQLRPAALIKAHARDRRDKALPVGYSMPALACAACRSKDPELMQGRFARWLRE